jgi:hypothetical protein
MFAMNIFLCKHVDHGLKFEHVAIKFEHVTIKFGTPWAGPKESIRLMGLRKGYKGYFS